jgi:hypothetical protein
LHWPWLRLLLGSSFPIISWALLSKSLEVGASVMVTFAVWRFLTTDR